MDTFPLTWGIRPCILEIYIPPPVVLMGPNWGLRYNIGHMEQLDRPQIYNRVLCL